jgi:hypothetical protein
MYRGHLNGDRVSKRPFELAISGSDERVIPGSIRILLIGALIFQDLTDGISLSIGFQTIVNGHPRFPLYSFLFDFELFG